MTRQEIIKANETCYTVGHNCTECPLFTVDKCNEKLMHEVLAMTQEVPDNGGWISVKDRLPELDTNVLWCAKYEPERVNAIRYSDRKWDIRISVFTGCINHGIPYVESYGDACVPLYWMPLPEPPEEDA